MPAMLAGTVRGVWQWVQVNWRMLEDINNFGGGQDGIW